MVKENKMKFAALIVSLLFSYGAYAQDARVIALSSEDAQTVQAKWDALQKAQKDFDAEKIEIEKKYTTVLEGDKEAGNMNVEYSLFSEPGSAMSLSASCNTIQLDNGGLVNTCPANVMPHKPYHYYRSGWEYGFTFDKDFKFIVPAPPVQINKSPFPYGTVLLN